MTRGARVARGRDDPATLVWIDRDEALIVRWDGAATIERIASEVPPHRRSTGHIRHDPTVRHGGGGVPTDRLERVQAARLAAFIREVAARIPPGDPVRIVGPGDVRQRLGRIIRAEDRRLERERAVDTQSAAPLTEPQLVAHVRELAGDPPPRRVVG
ncbi:MAG: hypothetical protein WEG56_12480 [Chloroflexota bacterium]